MGYTKVTKNHQPTYDVAPPGNNQIEPISDLNMADARLKSPSLASLRLAASRIETGRKKLVKKSHIPKKVEFKLPPTLQPQTRTLRGSVAPPRHWWRRRRLHLPQASMRSPKPLRRHSPKRPLLPWRHPAHPPRIHCCRSWWLGGRRVRRWPSCIFLGKWCLKILKSVMVLWVIWGYTVRCLMIFLYIYIYSLLFPVTKGCIYFQLFESFPNFEHMPEAGRNLRSVSGTDAGIAWVIEFKDCIDLPLAWFGFWMSWLNKFVRADLNPSQLLSQAHVGTKNIHLSLRLL